LLWDYLKAMGLFPYEAAFFVVSKKALGILVEWTDPGSEKDVIFYFPD